MAKKMDASTVEAIKQLLEQYNMSENGRVVIDLKNHLVSDLMGLRGKISNERAEEWFKEIEQMRNNW
jgi:hypothetical protein